MKKISVILMILLVFLLGACDNSSTSESNEIAGADLNEREDTILSTTSDNSFVFDYHIEKEYEEVVVWIEKYASGELVDDKYD